MVNPTLEQWCKLYDVWLRVKGLAPWEWMTEDQVFGVKNPETGSLGFVSVMGLLGEYFAVAVYLGARGLYKFREFQRLGPAVNPMSFFEAPQMHASFEDRSELTDQDRAVISRLKLKFRGPQAWPQFRSYVPGYAPWYLEMHEALFLTDVLEQLLEVAPRIKANPGLLPDPNRKRYLVRVPAGEGDARTWSDREQYVQPAGATRLNMPMDGELLAHVKTFPQRRLKLELDLFMLPAPIHDHPSGRPYFPYIVMMLEMQAGAIVGQEMLRPVPELKTVWEDVPMAVLTQLANLQERPAIIYVPGGSLYELLERLASEVGVRLVIRRELRYMEGAKQMMMEFLRRGGPPPGM
ncbi:MAG: hypothetical protein K8S97_15605 [Anaerolineae bacterium]|nr:hypothetical protein [Anaerolineae bacterium]